MNKRFIEKHKQNIGHKFGHLTIVDIIYDEKEKSYNRYKYICECECGNKCVKRSSSILRKFTTTCGEKNCKFNYNLNKSLKTFNKYKQYIGQKFGHLNILDVVYDEKTKQQYNRHQFKCKCDCGKIIIKSAEGIVNGYVKTCSINCKFNYDWNKTLKAIDKYKQYVGQKFNHLIIIDVVYDEKAENDFRYNFKCLCDCGNECIKSCNNIISGRTTTCAYLNCKFSQTGQTIEKYKSMIGHRFNKLTIIKFIFNKEENNQYYRFQFKCKCDCGNNEYYIFADQLMFRTPIGCNKCTPVSYQEQIFGKWLNELNLNYKKTFISSTSNIQNRVEIDFLIDNQLGIELHGLNTHATTHYDYDNPFIGRKPKKYHLNKLNSAVNNDIELLQFWNTELIQKQDICKSIVLSRLGKNKYREYARKCTVKEIDKQTYDEFMNSHHIQGTTKNENIRLGLFYKGNDNLISVMSFGNSRFDNNVQYEMYRFVTYKFTQVVGAASKLFKYFIRNYDPISIVSYSDRRIFNNGKLYDVLGFKFSHNSDPSYWYFKKNIPDKDNKLFHRSLFMKHTLKNKLKTFDPNLTEWQNMEQNGYLKVYDCGNKVYVWKK